MIEVENLQKRYAAFPAVKGVSFRVEPGEVVGFLGPNGAGKTTTLRILTGYMPASEGRVEVAGFDVARESRSVRRSVGYLPEDVPLYRDLEVETFLRYMAGLKEIRGITEEVGRVIARTGLEPVRKRLVGKCSKGYRQRTGLAMALLGDPPVLLLDEPTSGLDPNQVIEVRELIRDLSGQKTVLLSSHILSEVSQICTRVLIIHQGNLVASGTTSDLAESMGSEPRIRIRVRGTPSPDSWLGLPGVTGVEAESAEGSFLIAVEDADRSAPLLAKAVVEQGLELLELSREVSDLESVFRAATGEERNA